MSAEDLAFANRTAELTPRGVRECKQLATLLPTQYDIAPQRAKVAVSEFTRTQQTAKQLGFRAHAIKPYPILNEVEHGIELEQLRAMLRRNQVPSVALQAAEKTLATAPTESVWIAHGLLIAGICKVLGTANLYERPVPRQCEVRRLTF